ncbi:response regulator transcription factor [Gilvimarinus xylanilyticus]|uniref:Response regulator transcription factor n=1 Tax=Gilvimarinus xylanilyticus TaxID=2944139 RepID=A0A9X2I475_9GAMM|nr:response regulator transcription factor [Gilvimarinus xylanilyticus]MCP8899137.1 response regulator transcription factor [Gilvimarinus xylanilyticus]
MHSLFITTSAIHSARWTAGFTDAKVYTNAEPGSIAVNTDTLVWLVLDGPWREHLTLTSNLGAKVVALTLNESASEARQLISLGARGYVHAMAAPELLFKVKTAVEYDGLWLGRELMQQLVAPAKPVPAPLPDVSNLSNRERVVAELVAQGFSNKEVARQLDITERTVKAHLGACFEKLQVRDRVQLTVYLRPLIRAQQ